MRRSASAALLTIVVAAALLSGCDSGGPSSEAPDTTSDGSASAPDETTPPAEDVGLVALEATTDGEKAALALAGSDEGRLWANGNWQSGVLAEGEPVLVGYQVQLYDGESTGYQLSILNGKVCSQFSAEQPPVEADAIIEFPYDSTNLFTWVEQPESAAQQEAVDIAMAYLKTTRDVTTTAGIETYTFAFPEVNGTYPMVRVFANTDTGTFSSGGNSFAY